MDKVGVILTSRKGQLQDIINKIVVDSALTPVNKVWIAAYAVIVVVVSVFVLYAVALVGETYRYHDGGDEYRITKGEIQHPPHLTILRLCDPYVAAAFDVSDRYKNPYNGSLLRVAIKTSYLDQNTSCLFQGDPLKGFACEEFGVVLPLGNVITVTYTTTITGDEQPVYSTSSITWTPHKNSSESIIYVMPHKTGALSHLRYYPVGPSAKLLRFLGQIGGFCGLALVVLGMTATTIQIVEVLRRQIHDVAWDRIDPNAPEITVDDILTVLNASVRQAQRRKNREERQASTTVNEPFEEEAATSTTTSTTTMEGGGGASRRGSMHELITNT